jgi:hypothetical protein
LSKGRAKYGIIRVDPILAKYIDRELTCSYTASEDTFYVEFQKLNVVYLPPFDVEDPHRELFCIISSSNIREGYVYGEFNYITNIYNVNKELPGFGAVPHSLKYVSLDSVLKKLITDGEVRSREFIDKVSSFISKHTSEIFYD